jgi:hypothetical protein
MSVMEARTTAAKTEVKAAWILACAVRGFAWLVARLTSISGVADIASLSVACPEGGVYDVLRLLSTAEERGEAIRSQVMGQHGSCWPLPVALLRYGEPPSNRQVWRSSDQYRQTLGRACAPLRCLGWMTAHCRLPVSLAGKGVLEVLWLVHGHHLCLAFATRREPA